MIEKILRGIIAIAVLCLFVFFVVRGTSAMSTSPAPSPLIQQNDDQ